MSNQRERVTREIIVKDYEYMDSGKNARKDIVAVYFSPTNAEAKAEREELEKVIAENPNAQIYFSDTLLKRLKSLTDSDGKSLYEINQENLDNETNHNLAAIQNAIKEDISPKSTPK